MRSKPTIFFCSAGEATDLVRHFSVYVTEGDWAHSQLWTSGVARPGATFLDALQEHAAHIDFAVIFCTPDDHVHSRGELRPAPRDNLLFELGYFIAKLGVRHVSLVQPRDQELKLPTDYLGYHTVKYDPSSGAPAQYLRRAATELLIYFRDTWDTPLPPLPLAPRSEPDALTADSINTSIVYKSSRAGIIPVYRDLESTLDWFSAFETAMAEALPSLSSRMLYYGPGLAEHWIRLADQTPANQQQRHAFDSTFFPILGHHLTSAINLIDLGIGDFGKGCVVLERLLRGPSPDTLNYFPLDVSYGMLSLALTFEPRTLASRVLHRVLDRGQVIGINSLFTNLHRYAHLFAPPARNIFLLLGNTLGNELHELQTLQDIARAMTSDDLLLVEVQLREGELTSEEEITKSIQPAKVFYAGPFLTLGCKPDQVELVVKRDREEEAARGIEAVTYKAYCRFRKSVEIVHVGFKNGAVRIPRAEIPVYVVRKYTEDALRSVFDEAGLTILELKATSTQTPSDRRFCYLAAQLKPHADEVRP